jgi:hypothetical protein
MRVAPAAKQSWKNGSCLNLHFKQWVECRRSVRRALRLFFADSEKAEFRPYKASLSLYHSPETPLSTAQSCDAI